MTTDEAASALAKAISDAATLGDECLQKAFEQVEEDDLESLSEALVEFMDTDDEAEEGDDDN